METHEVITQNIAAILPKKNNAWKWAQELWE